MTCNKEQLPYLNISMIAPASPGESCVAMNVILKASSAAKNEGDKILYPIGTTNAYSL